MKENGALDRYFRRKDTILAQTLSKLSPRIGRDYRNSRIKRISDVVLALPLYIATLPVEKAAEAAIRLIDHVPPLYRQDRYTNQSHFDGTLQTMTLIKLRTMREGSDQPDQWGKHASLSDKAVTTTGKVTRRFNIDELPQLRQILRGELSFVGLRPIHANDYKRLLEVLSKEEFSIWQTAYLGGKPGLLHPRAVFEGQNRKEDDTQRFSYDVFYAKHASLGLDLYYLWRFLFVRRRRMRRKSLAPTLKTPSPSHV